MFARIAGVGSYLPGQPVSNTDLIKRGSKQMTNGSSAERVSRHAISPKPIAQPAIWRWKPADAR